MDDAKIERTLKKKLVKQLQDLKKKDMEEATFYYVNNNRPAKNNHAFRKTVQNKRRYYEIMTLKQNMQ